MAANFAGDNAWREEARLAGLLHDLGKYGELFQNRLKGLEKGLDHWSAGAWIALRDYKSTLSALSIQGHHVGLQQGDTQSFISLKPEKLASEHPLGLRLTGPADDLKALWVGEIGAPTLKHGMQHRQLVGSEKMLETRFVFSALTDSDYLDTEAHFLGDASGSRHRSKSPDLQPGKALEAVLKQIASLAEVTKASKSLREVREALLRDAITSSEKTPGLFTFTAPTGSGKTLAMLAFALAHAQRYGLRRIIFAVPYLSILEQTAKTYRNILQPLFGDAYLLEHHSLAGLTDSQGDDPEKERLRRLSSENWDAPLVLTTNVQLLESLFSNRPSACRKLHRLDKSVILFDEAQSLPLGLAVPTLASLSHLSFKMGTSIVFATATQPAYSGLGVQVQEAGGLDWKPQEVVASSNELFDKCRRVKPSWEFQQGQWEMERLAQAMRENKQSLCIVNLKRHALELMERLNGEQGLLHLSTNLCPSHRRVVLDQVRKRLEDGQPCRLVATQCIEAGVDVDFPIVFRALGPLEAIAQAAGRCNREGRVEMGQLKVFELLGSGKAYPDDAYHQAAEVTRALLVERQGKLDLDLPETFNAYYRRLFNLARPEAKNPELSEAIAAGDFVEVARLYRLIRQDTINVLVPYEENKAEYQALLEIEINPGINANWMRRAQLLAVGCFRPALGHPAWGVLKPARLRFQRIESEEWFLLNDIAGWVYDANLGLRLPERKDSPSVMIA